VAVRIEFFTVAGTIDFELVPHAALDAAVAAFDAGTVPGDEVGPVRCVGWLSASDEDEARLAGWCSEVGDDLGVSLLRQGVDEAVGLSSVSLATTCATTGSVATSSVATTAVPPAVDDGTAAWAAALQGALDAGAGGRIGWRTNYDVSGTEGTPDDYPTASRPMGA
jgi:hypothetical protein